MDKSFAIAPFRPLPRPPPRPAAPRRHPSPPDRPDTDQVVGGSLTRFPRSPCGGDTCRDAETTRRTRRRESRVLSDAGEKRRGQLRSPDAKHDDRCQRTFPRFFSSPLSFFILFLEVGPFFRDSRTKISRARYLIRVF